MVILMGRRVIHQTIFRFFLWLKQCHLHHPLVITIFRGAMFTIPSHGWFMASFYPHYLIFRQTPISHMFLLGTASSIARGYSKIGRWRGAKNLPGCLRAKHICVYIYIYMRCVYMYIYI